MARDKKNLTALQIWFEEAWEGWIRPLGAIMLLALGYLLYRFDILGERPAGVIAVLAIVVGALATGVLPAWPLARLPWQRGLLATLTLVALAACLYPALHAAAPAASLTEATLSGDKLSTALTTGRQGPYEVTVSGRLKPSGNQDAEASYNLKAVDGSGASDEVSGSIKRHYATYRRKGGSTSALLERNENVHPLPHVRGPQVTLTVDGLDEQLDGGLTVALRPGGLNPLIFLILGVMALLMALALDVKLVDLKGKLKGYLLPTVAIAFAFAQYYPEEATPHALVRPAVSGLLFALAVGGLGGWVIGAFFKLIFTPKVKKPASRR
jgi:hypothetical protein